MLQADQTKPMDTDTPQEDNFIASMHTEPDLMAIDQAELARFVELAHQCAARAAEGMSESGAAFECPHAIERQHMSVCMLSQVTQPSMQQSWPALWSSHTSVPPVPLRACQSQVPVFNLMHNGHRPLAKTLADDPSNRMHAESDHMTLDKAELARFVELNYQCAVRAAEGMLESSLASQWPHAVLIAVSGAAEPHSKVSCIRGG